MNDKEIEKVGSVVFAIQRLRMSLAAFAGWMSNQRIEATDGLAPSKMSEISSIAKLYFEKENTRADTVDKFTALVQRMTLLEQRQSQLATTGSLGEVDTLVVACNEAHLLLADIVEAVGYTNMSGDLLRSKQISP